ncbi:MAG TPA: DUF262 domain-containing protein [Acidimicrobiales bacterium]|jgi:hypothetical protein|nr:DUF262 domain-containing protein [Acidimicrobiales bacterium]
MPQLSIQKTVYKVSDFLGWQREESLILSPSFQRRPVWKPMAKSFLIDTLVRGFPVPVVYIRERVDLDIQRTVREVVDGQQRLRTIISFIDPSALPDFDPDRDEFTVRATHNSDIAGKPYGRLPADVKATILGYEFSTHILASDTDDRDILQMFSRINSTGLKLTPQELRNAQFFGAFKGLMYELALEQLSHWRAWNIFTEDQIARMKEVEMTSDVVVNMISGITAKRQPVLDKWYEDNDDDFPPAEEIAKRFQRTFDELDDVMGDDISESAFRSEVLAFSLIVLVYDLLYGLESSLSSRRAHALPRLFRDDMLRAGEEIAAEEAPPEVLDAVRRAPVDAARRQVRHDFLREHLHVPLNR